METIQPSIDRLAQLSIDLSSDNLAEASKLLDELAVALRQGERIAANQPQLELTCRAFTHTGKHVNFALITSRRSEAGPTIYQG
jgi:sensor c-di-GMP phosphodiesterase-like protein